MRQRGAPSCGRKRRCSSPPPSSSSRARALLAEELLAEPPGAPLRPPGPPPAPPSALTAPPAQAARPPSFTPGDFLPVSAKMPPRNKWNESMVNHQLMAWGDGGIADPRTSLTTV
ncbi:hypothetical protein GH733_014992 [Mirounga leonina]|nr:hypothetical protein GH733_014992 [Mirounga leonina]